MFFHLLDSDPNLQLNIGLQFICDGEIRDRARFPTVHKSSLAGGEHASDVKLMLQRFDILVF